MNFLVFLPIISLMMFVHELGHFVTARLFGITVQEFGFGLPPRLIGIRRNGVIYSLNLIPFGAFVKMLGEEDPTAPGSFAGKPRLVRAIVLAAGSFMNFLLAIVAFTLMFQVGVPYIDPNGPASFSSVMVDSPAAQAGIQAGDQVVSFNGQAVTVDQFRRLTRENEGQTVQLVIDREGAQVPITVTPHRDADSQAVVIGVILASNGSPNPLESLVDGTKFAASQVVGTFLIPKQINHRHALPALRPDGRVQRGPGGGQHAAHSGAGRWPPVLRHHRGHPGPAYLAGA
jgi:regulator of sigma E protease